MTNGRGNSGARKDRKRVAGRFVALPHEVLDSPAYQGLGYPARALLLEIAYQYTGDNNGRLLASKARLSTRGWNSSDVLSRAKNELMEARFIHETVKGHRPNKASWYAAAILRPFGGTGRGPIAPSAGALQSPATPARGAIAVYSGVVLEPPAGHHLEKPSALTVFQDSKRVERNMAMDARSHDPSPEVETGFAK
jgi:hypothetical protein